MIKAVSLCTVLLLVACGPLQGAGDRPPGTRQVVVTVPPELVSALGAQNTGLQLAGVVIADGAFSMHASPGVDPAVQQRLIAYLPTTTSPTLLVQTLSAAGLSSPGKLLALLRFADGRGGQSSRLPRGDQDLDLGLPLYSGIPVTPASSFLEVDDAYNPLGRIDSDADGTADLMDLDDDGDATPDLDDPDADGDGIEDPQQGLGSLEDANTDGVPDIFQ